MCSKRCWPRDTCVNKALRLEVAPTLTGSLGDGEILPRAMPPVSQDYRRGSTVPLASIERTLRDNFAPLSRVETLGKTMI